MFRPLRDRRYVALLALALQLCLGWTSVSALLHDDSDDPVCNPVLVLHDHNAHHVGQATGTAPHTDHCVLCHTLSFRSLVATADTWSPAAASRQIAAVTIPRSSTSFVARRPARAPPLA